MNEATLVESPGLSLRRRGYWLALAFAVLCLACYHETVWSMVRIWMRSDTFAHGFLILPISAWLVWERRQELAAIPVWSMFYPLTFLVPLGLLWLASHLVEVLVVQQFALVAMVLVGVWAILGSALARALAFPLTFLFLAVPAGEGLIDPMMELTATSTVWLVQMSGVPVFREGLYFTLPSGHWSVVEACSGVRYLIASFTLGVLYAHLNYRSRKRQLLFVLAAIVVPVVANSLRAYMIVMLGHFSGMTIAVGVDHLIYGWIFFGVVILLLFWVGSFFREDLQPAPEEGAPVYAARGDRVDWRCALLALVIAGFWPVLASSVSSQVDVTDIRGIEAERPWRQSGEPLPWKPMTVGGQQWRGDFSHGNQQVGVFLAERDGPQGSRELIRDPRAVATAEGDWRLMDLSQRKAALAAQNIPVVEMTLMSPQGRLLLWDTYHIGGQYTVNSYRAKLYRALSILGLAPEGARRLTLVTPYADVERPPRDVLQAFLNAHAGQFGRGG